MIYNDVIIGETPSNVVQMNKTELISRLGQGIDIDSLQIKELINKYYDNVIFRFAYAKVPFKIIENTCYFENEKVISSSVHKVLQDANEVFLLAVTSGIKIDKLIAKLSIQIPSEAFYMDAIASAGIESYIDFINYKICEGLNVTKRFSPGYSDFPLEFQKYLINRLSANDNLGIMLSNDYLMLPRKSITAVIGIK